MDNQHTETTELSERTKGLLTLLCDKITSHGYMMGAHRNRNWITQKYYDHAPDHERMQGTLDRIGKVTYHKSFLVDEKKHDLFKPCYLGPDLYKHNIRCHWREPFGEGWGSEPSDCLKSTMTQDSLGRWHMPCDLGIWITLWHPSEQSFQERIYDCWDLHPGPDWRPRYHYTDVEVKEALQIMASTFNWAYEEGSNMETIIFR